MFEQGLDQARASQEPKLLKNNDYLLKVRGRQLLGVDGWGEKRPANNCQTQTNFKGETNNENATDGPTGNS